MTAQRALAEGLRGSGPLLTRGLDGFDDGNRTRQGPGLPNHVAWILGHCALTMHRVAERLDGAPLPEADFIVGGDAGDARRFGTETVAYGSAPADDPTAYPLLARAVAIYDAAIERVAAATEAASDADLATVGPWGGRDTTASALVSRMIFHNGAHAGQLLDLRRALGLPPILPKR